LHWQVREAPLADARLTGQDKRSLLLWVLLGIVGAFFAHKYFFRAFPEAAVDFKVSRAESQKRARAFVESLGENLSGYQSTITFDVDENAKTYLERELGLQHANQMMASELNIWYWDVRFFRPQQEEEFRVRVNPAGQVVGYDHRIEEARASKSLTRDQAFQEAQQFLQAKLNDNLANWTFLPEEVNSVTRPNRVDWSFTWERTGFKAKEAPYRVAVGVQGDRIGSSEEFLRVPEAWMRDYQHLRSTNLFYNTVAIIPYIFLIGAVLWLGISLARQGKTSWRGALILGAIVAALFFLMQLNDWNSIRAGYDTHYSYSSFMLRSIFSILLGAIGTALTVSLVLPGGEPLYREAQPQRLRLSRAFTSRGIRSKEFFSAAVVGLSLAAAHIGFIVAFYIVAGHFGAWAPQDLNYSDVVNTSFPWIAGVTIGVLAATSEEFLFRMFAIPFLHKLTGSRIIAVILPAFFWSFLHSAYPQEPGYIRGVEVGLIGIVAGIVMLHWGIVATLIWHYTVDASLVGLLLIRSQNPYFKISGIVVGLAALAPLLFSGILYLARGRFEEVDDLLNGAEPAPEISLARQTIVGPSGLAPRRYEALTTGTIVFLALCILFGGLAAWRLKREHIGDYLEMSVDRNSVMQKANAVMQQRGLAPKNFRQAAVFLDNTNPVTNEFLRRRMPISQINDIYAHHVPGALWRVRYFRDSQPEEYAVTLKPDGSLQGFWHTLPEAAKGANLSKEEAGSIAQKYVRDQKQIDLTGWKLVEANSNKLPNRTDTILTWQQDAPLDPANSAADSSDHAFARMEMKVLGDEPADFRTYVKIPDSFVRHQEEQSLVRTAAWAARIAVALALVVGVLVLFFQGLRSQTASVPWKRLLGWSGFGIAAAAASFAFGSAIPVLFAGYQTSIPWRIFLGSAAVGILVAGAFYLGLLTVLFGLAWSFGARAFGEERLPTWLRMPANYYRDAFWIGLGGSALLIGLRRALDYASAWWPTLHRELPADFGMGFDAFFPGVALIAGALLRTLFAVAVLALTAAVVGAELRARWLRLLLFLALPACLVFNWGSRADFLKQYLAELILLAVVIFALQQLIRLNMLGLFLIAACTALLASAAQFLAQPDAFYRYNGYLLLLAIVVLFAWPLMAWWLGRNAPPEAPTAPVNQNASNS
jgi:membrane protease YdiL (CAAX protease family)